jgi:hypothetical protein
MWSCLNVRGNAFLQMLKLLARFCSDMDIVLSLIRPVKAAIYSCTIAALAVCVLHVCCN